MPRRTTAPFLGGMAILLLTLLPLGCGTSSYARRHEEDALISRRVNEALQVAGIDRRHVQGTCFRHVATLLGQVSDAQEREAAEAAVQRVDGVDRVNNLILVSGTHSKAADTAAAARVR